MLPVPDVVIDAGEISEVKVAVQFIIEVGVDVGMKFSISLLHIVCVKLVEEFEINGIGSTNTCISIKLPMHPNGPVGVILYVTTCCTDELWVSNWLITFPDPELVPKTPPGLDTTVQLNVVPTTALGFDIAIFVLNPLHIV
jgi:hypothetical protein